MSVRVRIAPSPTGSLHIGTARTAVFNWLFARAQGGQFILRIEDTDLERSKPEHTENIMSGLKWLGLDWDEEPVYQTQRTGLYRPKIQQLLDQGLAYRAYDTPEELTVMREQQQARKQAPRYDNRHRNLTPEQIAAFEAEGRQAVIRFKIDDDRVISWTDMVRGKVTWKGSDLGGDMVIARATDPQEIGAPLYNFVVVVDDADMKISHVIRGEDHIGNTPKQILLYEALGETVPEFGHTPLILNERGAKLSKRDGVTSISDFQEKGYTAEGISNYMTLLGWSPVEGMEEIFSLEEAGKVFSFDRVNKAGAKFDWDKLNWINSQYLHAMPVGELTDKLVPYWQAAGYTFDALADRPWLEQITTVIGPSLATLPECVEMTRYLFVPEIEFTEEALSHLKKDGVIPALQAVLERLPDGAVDEDGAKAIISDVVKAQGVKKGLVMKSLRAGLTHSLKGPDLMQSILLLTQKGWAKQRLTKAIAQG
ncbi:glutamate--tRNA ligase [filamentous cyanobacterium LEGE 11480]|uniref:Glutamate--tRNA ligase n=1 Tax=Romeriopsis navalis LEGE 11480 TaxID=2777977 RepID=A0A928VLA3_9CYAN|nr:glutamate--tRNA ligase [Romeriopsis navalis]MBE9030688.1 glutamate--tRNA ligase [Romeriopsis navalis LEGE 11480]